MANAPQQAESVPVEPFTDAVPAVHCLGCAYEWHSEAMAEGLRLLGTCPKCGGELAFAGPAPPAEAVDAPGLDLRAPHLVLGVPRR
jgi:hypothetical protein